MWGGGGGVISPTLHSYIEIQKVHGSFLLSGCAATSLKRSSYGTESIAYNLGVMPLYMEYTTM